MTKLLVSPLLLTLLAGPALGRTAAAATLEAGDPEVVFRAPAPSGPVAAALPLGAVAAIQRGAGFVVANAGYDGGARRLLAETTAELGLHERFALRAGVMANDSAARPVAGLRVQLLREARHGLDASAMIQYKPEGFTEGEGEIELVAAARRSFGRVAMVAGLAYGQDPEARERDGEARLGALIRLGERAELGVDGRVRANLGGRGRVEDPRYEVLAGPVAALALGPAFLTGQAGVGCTALQGRAAACGPTATAGLGATF